MGIKYSLSICVWILVCINTYAQEVRAINNKGTITSINNNRAFTQATDPNPTLPIPPIAVEGDIWFDTSTTPNTVRVWNGTSWVPIINNAWLKANTVDVPTSVNDNIYTNGKIGINDDNPDYTIKIITVGEGIDRFLRMETDDSSDFLEISNTTGASSVLSGGFIGGTLTANRSSLNFFGDTQIADDLANSTSVIRFFARRGSNNANIVPNPYGGGAGALTNRPLFDFLNGNSDSKLRILANGNIGLDIDTPTEKLDINGKLRIRDIATATTNNDILTATTNGVVEKRAASKFENTWLGKDDNLAADISDTEIYKDGKVGVGDFSTSTIDANLHVKSSGANVPFKIEPNATTPVGTSGGQMYVDNTNGILYIFDGTRNKWLSVSRFMIGWGRNLAATNEYLRQFNGALSNNNGWRMIRNGTITAITAQSNINQSWTLEIRKNDNTPPIATLVINAAQGNHNNTLNVNVNEGDFIQAFCNGTSIDFPQALIEIAWRK